jgi:hypothetical protein
MTDRDALRRAFLTGSAGFVASAAFAAGAVAQSKLTINDPNVLREVEAEFAGYDRALGANDVAALNGYFFASPSTVRYGIRENLYGYSEIQAYRASATAPGVPPKRERTVITTFGMILRRSRRCLDRFNPAKSVERCKPGCACRRAGELSPLTSAPSTSRRSRNDALPVAIPRGDADDRGGDRAARRGLLNRIARGEAASVAE